MPRTLIQAHVEQCKGASSRAVNFSTAGDPAGVDPPHLKTQESERDPRSGNGTPGHAPVHQQTFSTAGNAFSLLMAEQREQSQVMVFFLEQKTDQTWHTYWWPKRPKTPAALLGRGVDQSAADCHAPDKVTRAPESKSVWSATTQISSAIMQNIKAADANKVKMNVQLQTNAAPGAEADVAQLSGTAPGTGGFKGSASLLKSALQKNVRLCRAAPAVRYKACQF